MADKQHNMHSWRGTVTIVGNDNSTTRGTQIKVLNGQVHWIDFTTANMQDTDSTNFTMTNEFGGTIFASGTVAEQTTFNYGSVFPVVGTTSIICIAEGTQSANREIPFNVFYET